jgi:hypothetical protein
MGPASAISSMSAIGNIEKSHRELGLLPKRDLAIQI